MAQVSHFGPYYWFGPFELGLPPGGQHSWSWGPNPGFAQAGLHATAHPERNPILQQVERRLAVTMIQSHRTPSNTILSTSSFATWAQRQSNAYSLWLTVTNP